MTADLSPGTATVQSSAAKPRRKSKLKWWVIGLSALLLVAIVLAVMKKRSANVGIAVTTDKATVKTIVQVVTATGKVQPEVEVKISPEVYGEIVALPFREGAHVDKGEVIVKIKPDFYQAQVDQQTAAVAAARAGAENSQVQLEKAEADLKKYQDLYDRKLVSDFDYVTY
jgi:HlyD family secretion protein